MYYNSNGAPFQPEQNYNQGYNNSYLMHHQRPQQGMHPQNLMPMNISPTNQNYMPIPNIPCQQNYNYPVPTNAPANFANENEKASFPTEDDRYQKQLIVNYLAPDVTTAELHCLFARFGPLDGARIIFDRQTKLPRGFGFVYYRHPDSAQMAINSMNGFQFHGKRLKVSYSTNPLNIISSNSQQDSQENSTNFQ
ncbi:RNA recognition motif. (a.k.a. RRM, RBD, or RNP domain), putative [Angomonas deanei]|uniref:RNA recognition motif. (A.k.a. RRM, RBD, or RNP domain), putative n=1 Tax=Angomonas deanei TaxID=59799 RepID=A0A7G2CFR8_9TRYP|nr:RNA recognition motif. (a.k.a. RRM, RBD, or RNP domain), putative [Angomonas deanei]